VRQKILWLYLIAASILTPFLLGACDNNPEETPEHVTYRLKWLFNISVVGDLYAEVHGIFAERGLRVAIKEGGPERDAIKELELGHAQFGVASADQVIRAVSKGAPVVVIVQLFQANPLQWMYRPEKTCIETPGDLKGKTIGITYGGNDESIMRALLSKYKIMNNEVRFFSVRYDYTPFYEGEVDLWPIYRNAEGVVIGEKLRKAGEQVSFFNPDEFGIRFVSNSVIITEHMLKERPTTIQNFISALLQGWREALDPPNKEKAVATIHRLERDIPIEVIRKQLAVTRMLMKPSPRVEIGNIDVEAWKQTETIMIEQKLIPGPVYVERILRPYSGFVTRETNNAQAAHSGMKCRMCSFISSNSLASTSASTSSASNQQID
jgi:NitT/TauT family transport system substrate-binding protein